jgi:excisionase family DNA binding protein
MTVNRDFSKVIHKGINDQARAEFTAANLVNKLDEGKIYTTQEIADIFHISKWTAVQLCKTGKIQAVKVDGKSWGASRTALIAYANKRYA